MIKKVLYWQLVFLLLFFSLAKGQHIKLKKTFLTPGISMLVPSDFTLMPDEVLARKYLTTKKPSAMYSDPTGEIDLGVNITNNYWQEQDIPMLKDLYKGSLRASYTKVQFFTEEVRTINKRQFVVLEFVGTVEDDKEGIMGKKNALSRYNYMMYTVVENRIVVVNFNCPAKYQSVWQPLLPKMMQSVKIRNLKENESKKTAERK